MKKIVLFSFFISLFVLPVVRAQNMIINDGPSFFTLIQRDGERMEIDPFFAIDYNTPSDTLYSYVVELKSDGFIQSLGYCYLLKKEGDFHLPGIHLLPIILENTLEEEILVEFHKYAFIMYPGEKRQVKDLYITHDLVAEIKLSYLIGDKDSVQVKDGIYIAQIKNGRVEIKL